ncbi:MAG: hypothetical protein U9Q35_00860 [Pseudomonadota bacterium]|nr:hypothetical protein [Pseudomonadota bacterium]
MLHIEETQSGITMKCPCGAIETVDDETHLEGFERGRGLDESTNMAYRCTRCGHVGQASRMDANP